MLGSNCICGLGVEAGRLTCNHCLNGLAQCQPKGRITEVKEACVIESGKWYIYDNGNVLTSGRKFYIVGRDSQGSLVVEDLSGEFGTLTKGQIKHLKERIQVIEE